MIDSDSETLAFFAEQVGEPCLKAKSAQNAHVAGLDLYFSATPSGLRTYES